MPKREASHELDMKRKRQAERGQRQDVSPLSAATSAPLCLTVHVMRLHNSIGAGMAILQMPSPAWCLKWMWALLEVGRTLPDLCREWCLGLCTLHIRINDRVLKGYCGFASE